MIDRKIVQKVNQYIITYAVLACKSLQSHFSLLHVLTKKLPSEYFSKRIMGMPIEIVILDWNCYCAVRKLLSNAFDLNRKTTYTLQR